MRKAELKTYWRYFQYVLEHKKNVFIEAMKRGCIIHAFTHDLSKFLPCEFFAYATKFFGGDYAYKYFEVEDAFEAAWHHHYHTNKHHWNYWLTDKSVPLEIPGRYIKQMVIDWAAMSRKFGDTPLEFYAKNKNKIILHRDTKGKLEQILKYQKSSER